MPTYPGAIYNPRTKENQAGVEYDPAQTTRLYAEDVVRDDDEIVAIETELGTNPRGVYASVAAFLADLLSKVISVFTDLTDVPASYAGQARKVVKVKVAEDGLEFGFLDSKLRCDPSTLTTHADASTTRPINTVEMTKVKEIRENISGVMNCWHSMRSTVAGQLVRSQVFKNGVAYGILRETSSATFTDYNENLAFVNGDLYQLYACYSPGYSTDGEVRNFRSRGILLPDCDILLN